MDSIEINIYDYNEYEDEDFREAISDLQKFGVIEDEYNLNYINDED